ncbi:MAG TPA: RNA 2',3'-cyclic phosphodiesterase [Cyclobacteriaceae bacterium]|nr:RNA 2',3'-cyclic phosphodiesterase [Cyclobacteriaceae bacterium]
MPRDFQKYFIAIVPEGEIQEKVTEIKHLLKETFNLKYALKSPAHITLKMPFSWDENRESRLLGRLSHFFSQELPFELTLSGIGRFGRKVIYVKVCDQEKLRQLQKNLGLFCRTRLQLDAELSDHRYQPHMTLAYKDTKEKFFEDYLRFIKGKVPAFSMAVRDVALLKRENRRWYVCHRFALAADIQDSPINLS